ncbi:hypothetical protein [Streptomyces phaeochromogenes]
MSAKPPLTGCTLALILLGVLSVIAAVVLARITGEDAWRFLVAGGCFLQFLGWVLHGRRLRSAR